MRGASESPRPRGHPGRGVGAPGRGVQRAVRTEPLRLGAGAVRTGRGRGSGPHDADRTPPPAFRLPVRPGTGAVRAGRGRGSGPHAHHVMRTGPLRLGSAGPCTWVRVRYAQAVRAAPVHTRTMWCGQDPSACVPPARAPGCGCGAPRGAQPQRPTAAHTRPMWWGQGPSACVPRARVRVRVRCAGRAPRCAQAQRAAQAHTRTMCSGVSRHAWGAVSLLGVRRDVGTGAGPDVPRTAAAAAPGCARCAATAPSPSSGGHRQRPSFPWTPVRAPRWAQAGRRRARHAPRAAAAPGLGACRQRRGEGSAVLGRCALASARVSASRRAGGGSTR